MELERAKKYLEKGVDGYADGNGGMFENFMMQGLGLRLDSIERGRVLCSMKVPVRLLNPGNTFHGGATISLVDLVGSAVILTYGLTSTGVSVEITLSLLDAAFANEEIEIEGRALRIGKTVAVVNVEFRKKSTAKIFAQARHTKYLHLPPPPPVQTKM
ncbi:hypothetical protein CXB51_026295 [Gossypium anomalum]|uniref:Acyl-coenzyme A thioesterase 13 n=1 Tax=Gossypium anomalum TaxID=47600 RepID=A0A8J6CT42_9ROSI|nr:hypothetical protein CXB51_026295 [Gossypium anomalum]